MLNFLTLKCANCGANLQVKTETTTFACGYCGESQIVERHGGTVSLHLLTNAVSKVQAGTDKTAAELAIRRIKDELAETEQKHRQLSIAKEYRINSISNTYLIGFVVISLFVLCPLTAMLANSVYSFILLFAWLMSGVGCYYAITSAQKSVRSQYNIQISQLEQEHKLLTNEIERQKMIVRS